MACLQFLLYLIGEAYGILHRISGLSFHRIFEDGRGTDDMVSSRTKAVSSSQSVFL